MCGIYGTTGNSMAMFTLKHRGPDTYSQLRVGNILLEFWRLAINGVENGMQPFEHDGKFLIANAEIYNHTDLGGTEGKSDCDVLLPLISRVGLYDTCVSLDGDFAFIYTDGKEIYAARDRVGVRPLFYCYHAHGIAFASEAKMLLDFEEKVYPFPPGHLYDSRIDKFICWQPNYFEPALKPEAGEIKYYLTKAVSKRISNTEKPIGFFLSGGLDSSIIASLAKSISTQRLRTFSIGMAGAPDLIAARQMATYLDSDHTEILFTPEEGIAAIRDVIWHLETYDTTTVRASIPMFLLSKYIKENTDIRVVLSGEGSDELFGGYLYFHGAPNESEFEAETMRLVQDVYMFDILRADRTTAAHGLELRVPFFDTEVIDFVMNLKGRMPREGYEKYLLRKEFESILPQDIAWRQKNGMSDAVGYEWRNALKKFGEHRYKKMFTRDFGNQHHLVPYMWMPQWSDATDPSATQLPHFKQ
jgi:asparagine synthase (glutamine-hydrolysing)